MQYEVVTGPLPPLEAADALVHTRETIYNIARKHGLRATLAPRLHIDGMSNRDRYIPLLIRIYEGYSNHHRGKRCPHSHLCTSHHRILPTLTKLPLLAHSTRIPLSGWTHDTHFLRCRIHTPAPPVLCANAGRDLVWWYMGLLGYRPPGGACAAREP